MSMVVLMFLYTLAYYQIVSGLPISMTQIGLGTDEYSSLLTINGGILCLLQIPAIALFQRCWACPLPRLAMRSKSAPIRG